jgi:hypothetical protein
VTRERSKPNVIAEKKSRTSSVTFKEQAVDLYLPSPVVKEPNKHVGLAELHRDGATNSKRSKTNVSNLMKHQSSSNSPWDRGEAQKRIGSRPHVNEAVNDQHSSSNIDPGKRTVMPSLGQVRFQYPPATLPTYWRGQFLPQLPSWEVQPYGHASPRCVLGCVFENASESVRKTLLIKPQRRLRD